MEREEAPGDREQPALATGNPWPDEVYEGLAHSVGSACYGLLFSQGRWVHRRVERIAVTSPEVARRSVSVDFTVPEMFWDHLKIPDARQWLVPLTTLPKRQLWNFDLRGEGGEAIPVLGQSANAGVAKEILFVAALEALGATREDELPRALLDAVAAVAVADPKAAESALLQIAKGTTGAGGTAAEKMAKNPRAALLLEEFAKRYLLIAVIDDIERRRIVKYAYDHVLTRGPMQRDIGQRLGWRPVVVETSVPAAARAASYHAEIEIPEQLRISGSFIYDEKTRDLYAFEGPSDHASLHAPNVPRSATPTLVFAIRTERTGFPVIACVTAWVTAVLLTMGAWPGRLEAENADAAIALLLAGSALFAGAIASSGERRMVRSQFALPRVVLATISLLGLFAAATLAFDLPACTINFAWKISASLSVCLACILSVTLARAAPATE
jgi:hypothetical protein